MFEGGSSIYTATRKAYPRLWRIWYRINQRCKNKELYYEDVKVSDDYHIDISGEQGFLNFVEDFADTHEEDLTIDRIDPKGHYEFSNMRWATRKVQNNNTRFHKYTERGQWLQRAKQIWGDSPATRIRFHNRMKRGYTPQEAAEKSPHPGVTIKQYRTNQTKPTKRNKIWQVLRSII